MTSHRRAAHLLVSGSTTLTEAIRRHMPAGPYRDFSAWAFSARNPRQAEFLRMTGLSQLIKMNVTMLSGLVEDDQWPEVLRYTSLMNAYRVLEMNSHNLAPELAGTVNRAMLEALTPGRSTPAVLLLAGQAQGLARATSAFTQGAAAAEFEQMAKEFARSHAGAAETLRELEFGVWPSLVTGAEVCRELIDAVAGTATAGLVRHGLADRYRAADRALFSDHQPRFALAAIGAQTILVNPALAYLIGMLLERVAALPAYSRVVSDGTLGEALGIAALLVRLQHDAGTRLMNMGPVQQAAEIRRLRLAGDEVQAALAGGADDAVFTRLRKDVVSGAGNVALWHARRAATPDEGWEALAESLAYFGELYRQHQHRLSASLAALDARLGDRRAGTMVERFVRFQEEMYSHVG